MLDPEAMRNTVEWKQARSEDAAIWVSVTRRSADQVAFESEDAQLVRYKEESPAVHHTGYTRRQSLSSPGVCRGRRNLYRGGTHAHQVRYRAVVGEIVLPGSWHR
jgi:hypothetical protein